MTPAGSPPRPWKQPNQHTAPPIEDRFWSFVEKTDTCWLWRGTRLQGYGRFSIGQKQVQAHRWAYERFVGPLEPGKFLCHHCDVRACVRLDHLFQGTPAENMADMQVKGRGTTPGAKLTPDQVLVDELRQALAEARTTMKEAADLLARYLWDGDTNAGGDEAFVEEAHRRIAAHADGEREGT